MKPAKFEFKITGLLLAVIFISMFAMVFSVTVLELNTQYGVTGTDTFSKYRNLTNEINNTVMEIQGNTTIKQQEGILDVIGGYFSAGYAALKVSATSFDLMDAIMDDATEDFEPLQYFKPYLWMFVAVAIFVGIIIAVLVKMRI